MTTQGQPEQQDARSKRLVFLDLVQAVIKTWDRSGYPWQVMVDGFGDGFGLGMPPIELFQEVAIDTVEAELVGQPQAELSRLMRSRLYHKHKDFELHYGFTHGNEDFVEREELLRLAVWTYLCREMERQYVEPRSFFDDDGQEDGDEEEESDEPEQLALPL